jgi:hypothetical protein
MLLSRSTLVGYDFLIMNGFKNPSKLIFYLLLVITSIYLANFPSALGDNFGVYSENESPFGTTFEDWLAKWWNWSYSIGIDPETNTWAGLKDNGCLIHKENSTVMLVDTAAGGKWTQNCKISHNDGILIPIWTGECNNAENECETHSFEELKKAARGFDLGKVKGEVKVDNIPIAKLDVVDYTTNIIENVSEIYTKEFNATIPESGHIPTEKSGIFPAAAHGWFVFLKPLPIGDHTISYKNTVEPTSLSGAGNINSGEFTYNMKVE